MHYQTPSNSNRNESAANVPGNDFVSRLVENGWPEFVKEQEFGGGGKNPAAGGFYGLFFHWIPCGKG
jgi:hypothetical protein